MNWPKLRLADEGIYKHLENLPGQNFYRKTGDSRRPFPFPSVWLLISPRLMNAGKRIVLTTHGTLGDLHPYLAIAIELKNRGHKPVIATSEYHRQKVEAANIDFHSIRPDFSLDDKDLHWRLIEPKRGLEHVIRELILPDLRATYDDLFAVVKNADLLISQILIFAAPIIAEITGVRWISTELQPGAFMSAYDPPVLAPVPSLAKLRGLGPTFHRPLFSAAKLVGHSWSKPVRELRRELKLPPGKNPLFEGRNSPHLVLALFSRVMGPPQRDWPSNTLVTGFPFYDESQRGLSPELTKFLAEGEPPIVFTLGSSAVLNAGTFYRESIAATEVLGKRAVLLVGDDPLNQAHGPLPSNVIALPYAPYFKIFPRASVIVHQGGIGTCGQAMRAGTPMLVMPFGGDQYDNAARLERLGVARTIMRNKYTAERAAIEINELLSNSTYRGEAEKLAQQVRAEDGVRVACDAIEEQLRQVV